MKAINTAVRMAGGCMSAPRVVLAWEHGRGHGHMARLRVVAGLVEQSGGIPIWALPPTCPHRASLIDSPHEGDHALVNAPVNAAARSTPGFGARSFTSSLITS